MRRSHFLRSLLSAALLATLLAALLVACGSPAAPNLPKDDPEPEPKPAPSAAHVSPEAATRGATIVISGGDFGDEVGTVTIGGYEAEIDTWTDVSVEAVVPSGASNGWQAVTVTTEGGTATLEGLFVGAEFAGEAADLQEFLDERPKGSAVLLGEGVYDVSGAGIFWLDNVDLYGRGPDLTTLQLPGGMQGGTLLLADYGEVTNVVGLSASGGQMMLAHGTVANTTFPPPNTTFPPPTVPGPMSVEPLRSDFLAERLGVLAEAVPMSSESLPTLVFRDVHVDGPLGTFPGATAALNIEIHDSVLAMPDNDLTLLVTGAVHLSGVESQARAAVVVSFGSDLRVHDSEMAFEWGVFGGTAGAEISGSALTASDGDVEVLGAVLDAFEVRLPGGPVSVTDSALVALNPEALGGSGNIIFSTEAAPISVTDNKELRSHGDLVVTTGRGLFGEAQIDFSRNPNVQVGVASEGTDFRLGGLFVNVYDSGMVGANVAFSGNNFTITQGLEIDSDSGLVNLEFSGNTGVVGNLGAGGYVNVWARTTSDVTVSDNQIEAGGDVWFGLRALGPAAVTLANNRFGTPESLLKALVLETEGFTDVSIESNDIVAREVYIEGSDANVNMSNNRVSETYYGIGLRGGERPAESLQFTGNEVVSRDTDEAVLIMRGSENMVVENNRLTVVGSPEEGSRFLSIIAGQSDTVAVVTYNSFSGDLGGVLIADFNSSSSGSLDVTINENVFDIPIGSSVVAVELYSVADEVDARHNVWGTSTDVAEVEAAVLLSGQTTVLGGSVLLDPISVPD